MKRIHPLKIMYLTAFYMFNVSEQLCITVKPVCNDHFYYNIFYLWLIQ